MENQTDEVNLPEISEPELPTAEIEVASASPTRRKRSVWWIFLSLLLAFALGFSSGYFAWGRQAT